MQEDTNNVLKSITIKIPEDFHKDIRIHIAKKGITLKDYIISLIKKDIEESK